MKSYSFPDLVARGDHDLIQRVMAVGKLRDGNTKIDLPDTFNFDGPGPKVLPPEIRKTVINLEPEEPSLLELTTNFTGALVKWAKAGFPLVTADHYAARRTICDRCEFWNPSARLGLGKCEKCGCSRQKAWLASERCPLNLWPHVVKGEGAP